MTILGNYLGGMGLGQYDPYLELQRQLMMQGMHRVTKQEYEKSNQMLIEESKEKKSDPIKQDENLILLTEEE